MARGRHLRAACAGLRAHTDPAWPADGRALCTALDDQYSPTIVGDGAGGAIVTWYDLRSGTDYDIYAQHVLASGAVDPAWPLDGRALCTAAGNQLIPTIVTDGAGGAIVTWSDYRSGTGYDIYAQRVARSGYLGTPEPVMAGVKDIPNDNGGKVRVAWTASYLDASFDPNLAAYDVYVSVPAAAAQQARARGALAALRAGDPAPMRPVAAGHASRRREPLRVAVRADRRRPITS